MPIRNRDDLSLIYTPGVARVCLAIAENPEDARRLTIKRNTVAVVTDGSAVLGLGNIGPLAALPVMEGKAALFKRFADIDAFPICLDTQDVDEIVAAVKAIAPGLRRHQPRGHLGAALLRDRGAAARGAGHPGLPRRPARHGDRHAGGAAQRAAGGRQGARRRPDRHVAAPAPPAPRSSSCCSRPGPRTSSSPTSHGVVHAGREDIADARRPAWPGSPRTPTSAASPARSRTPSPAPTSSSACLGPGLLTGDDIATMNDDAIVFAHGQPRPRGRPHRGRRSTPPSSPPGAATSPTRSTTCWSSPASSAACSTRRPTPSPTTCCSRPPRRCPRSSTEDELNAAYIIPSVFHPDVSKVVAAAVEAAARSAPPGPRRPRGGRRPVHTGGRASRAGRPRRRRRRSTAGSARGMSRPASEHRRRPVDGTARCAAAGLARPARVSLLLQLAVLYARRRPAARVTGWTRWSTSRSSAPTVLPRCWPACRAGGCWALLALHAPVSELVQATTCCRPATATSGTLWPTSPGWCSAGRLRGHRERLRR